VPFLRPAADRAADRPPDHEVDDAQLRAALLVICRRRLPARRHVGLDDFTTEALGDPQKLALAHRLHVVEDDNPDPNALVPQRVEIDLAGGRTVARSVDAVLGSPTRPLTAEPCAGNSRGAGAQSLSCRSIKVRLCGTQYQLSKTSEMFVHLRD